MTPELTKKLARIKAACRKVLELDAKATPGPWSSGRSHRGRYAVDTNMEADPHNISYDVHQEANAAFIAYARSITPDMARATLKQIENHKAYLGTPIENMSGYVAAYAVECLQSIADSFTETSLP